MEAETKQIVVQKMSTDLWRKLKMRAAAEESTIQNTLAKAIQQYLQKSA
jgi:hypothetical protein